MPQDNIQERHGIGNIGFVIDFNNEVYLNYLRRLTGDDSITQRIVDDFIDSMDCHIEYLDEEGDVTTQEQACVRRFKTPWKTTDHDQDIYGVFCRDLRNSNNFIGVQWVIEDWNRFHPYVVNSGSWKSFNDLRETLGFEGKVSQYCFEKACPGGRFNAEYYNSNGYNQYREVINGETVFTPVPEESAVFIRYETSLRKNGEIIYGWFTKIGQNFEGIDWGTEEDFRAAISEWKRIRPCFSMGRMTFKSREGCNTFLQQLNSDIIPEPWQYRDRSNETILLPILKSYLENVLDRLYYEKEKMHLSGKIVPNRENTRVSFNSNLMHRYGEDVIVVGETFLVAHKQFVYNLETVLLESISYSRYGFDNNLKPRAPRFLDDIDSPIYKSDWLVDQAPERYDHIIKERKERFPERYRHLADHELGRKLKDAISFAKEMAQRSYTYIVPMYYPKTHRTQFLMPIYLDGSWSRRPDFTLVLDPQPEIRYYRPMTILGLDEAYQDARLVNKPGESWLNDSLLKEQGDADD